jgi:hypothetical protein
MRSGFFHCAKAAAPITIRSRFQHDLAIQCALDPAVRALEFIPSLPFRGAKVDIEMIAAEFDDGRFVLDIFDDSPLRDIDSEGLHLLAIAENGIGVKDISANDIQAEPLASSCKHVWQHRYCTMSPLAVALVTGALRTHASIGISDLRDVVGLEGDIYPIIYAMACANLVGLDLSSGLHSRMLVSMGKSAPDFPNL